MAGHIRFDSIPRLPKDWWDGSDADNVWPTWGEFTSYFWGANSGNQFLARGDKLNGGGLASDRGPSRGRAHPQYVGLDTMSDSSASLAANTKVYGEMAAYLGKGHTLIVPVDLRTSIPDPGKFSLGTGYGINVSGATKIHAEMWGGILNLISQADDVTYYPNMWTPDVSLPAAKRDGSRLDLPDLPAIKAYHTKLVNASGS